MGAHWRRCTGQAVRLATSWCPKGLHELRPAVGSHGAAMADRSTKKSTLIEFSVLLVLHVTMFVAVVVGLFW